MTKKTILVAGLILVVLTGVYFAIEVNNERENRERSEPLLTFFHSLTVENLVKIEIKKVTGKPLEQKSKVLDAISIIKCLKYLHRSYPKHRDGHLFPINTYAVHLEMVGGQDHYFILYVGRRSPQDVQLERANDFEGRGIDQKYIYGYLRINDMAKWLAEEIGGESGSDQAK